MINISNKPVIIFSILILISISFIGDIFAGVVPNSWLHSLVLIEKRVIEQGTEYYKPIGSGFLTKKKNRPHLILITNEHVIKSNINNLPLFVRLNKRSPAADEIKFIRIPLTIRKGRFAIDPKSDLAAFYLIVPKHYNQKTFHISQILPKDYLTIDSVPLADRILLVGFPTSLEKIKKLQEKDNMPVLWSGIVSAKYKEHDMNFILIDAPSYWGNSGGPVFIIPSRIADVITDGDYEVPPKSPERPMFIGVVSSMIVAAQIWKKYDEDSNEEKELASAWHSGLSIVIPADYILELLKMLPDIN